LVKTKVVEEEEITLVSDKSLFEAWIREKNLIQLSYSGVHYANLISANNKLRPKINELSIKLTPGCYSPSPLKESRPEIHAR
jgi:hypothetical protein